MQSSVQCLLFPWRAGNRKQWATSRFPVSSFCLCLREKVLKGNHKLSQCVWLAAKFRTTEFHDISVQTGSSTHQIWEILELLICQLCNFRAHKETKHHELNVTVMIVSPGDYIIFKSNINCTEFIFLKCKIMMQHGQRVVLSTKEQAFLRRSGSCFPPRCSCDKGHWCQSEHLGPSSWWAVKLN